MRGFTQRDYAFSNIRDQFARLDANRRFVMENFGQLEQRYIDNLLCSLRSLNDQLEHDILPFPQPHPHPPVLPDLHFEGNNNSQLPQLPQMPHMRTFNTTNNNGFEMVTTISTTSSSNLPESFFNVVRNIFSDTLPTMHSGIDTPITNFEQENVVVPLPKECIKQMPSKRYKKKSSAHVDDDNNVKDDNTGNDGNDGVSVCTVCFDDFKQNERYRKLPCNHCFHKRCIDKWFAQSVKCPMCTQDIRELLVQKEEKN